MREGRRKREKKYIIIMMIIRYGTAAGILYCSFYESVYE